MKMKIKILFLFSILSLSVFPNNYWNNKDQKTNEKVQKEIDKFYIKFKSKDLTDKAIEKMQKQEKEKQIKIDAKRVNDYSDLNNKRYTKTRADIQGDNPYMNDVYNPVNKQIRTQDNVRFIMTDVADRTKGGNKRTETRNDDYRGVLTLEGTKKLDPVQYSDDWRPAGSSLGGGTIIYNMWSKDRQHRIKHAKVSGVAGDDKAFIKAAEDIFDGYKKPSTAKTQQKILEAQEALAYVAIAKLQIAQENMKNIEAKYKSAESVDKFFDDPNNVEMLKQMDKYNDELRNAIISTTQLENMYSKIGKPTSDKAQLEKVNEERLSFLANMAEFSQKLQKQQSIGDINEIKKLSSTGKADYKKLSYKDMENITFDKLYSMIKNGDQKSIPENLAILDSLMKQNNSLFNYTLTTLIGFKNTNNYQEIRDMQIKQNEVQKYAETFIGFKQSALSFFLPTDKELENLKKADPKNGTPKNELIKHNSGIALNTIILGK